MDADEERRVERELNEDAELGLLEPPDYPEDGDFDHIAEQPDSVFGEGVDGD